jgi:hypothetical protein
MFHCRSLACSNPAGNSGTSRFGHSTRLRTWPGSRSGTYSCSPGGWRSTGCRTWAPGSPAGNCTPRPRRRPRRRSRCTAGRKSARQGSRSRSRRSRSPRPVRRGCCRRRSGSRRSSSHRSRPRPANSSRHRRSTGNRPGSCRKSLRDRKCCCRSRSTGTGEGTSGRTFAGRGKRSPAGSCCSSRRPRVRSPPSSIRRRRRGRNPSRSCTRIRRHRSCRRRTAPGRERPRARPLRTGTRGRSTAREGASAHCDRNRIPSVLQKVRG